MFVYTRNPGDAVIPQNPSSLAEPVVDCTTEISTDTIPAFKQIRLEVTNNCAYRCFCCPREKMTRPRGVMSSADLALLIERVGSYDGIVHYHGYGEALIDKDLGTKIRMVKTAWPRSQSCIVTTLGIPLNENVLRNLFEAGLSDIRISLYGYSRKEYEAIHGIDAFDRVVNNLDLLSRIKNNYPLLSVSVILSNFEAVNGLEGLSGNPDGKRNFADYLMGKGFAHLKSMNLHNYGDGRCYREAGSSGVCSIVWGRYRSYLQVSWNLNVIPCCMCYNDQIILGSLKTQSLQDIFLGEVYRKFVHAHRTNQLEPYPLCSHCHKDFTDG
jgi:hypothetical protein